VPTAGRYGYSGTLRANSQDDTGPGLRWPGGYRYTGTLRACRSGPYPRGCRSCCATARTCAPYRCACARPQTLASTSRHPDPPRAGPRATLRFASSSTRRPAPRAPRRRSPRRAPRCSPAPVRRVLDNNVSSDSPTLNGRPLQTGRPAGRRKDGQVWHHEPSHVRRHEHPP